MSMREIKFRGERADNGEWVFGSFIPDALEGSNSDLVSWGFIRRYNRDVSKMETIEVDRETVGQYTGLKDKNGVEIYEGDIVNIFQYGYVVAEFAEGCYGAWDHYGFSPFRGTLFGCGGEVIGNIHDNPELMEDTL